MTSGQPYRTLARQVVELATGVLGRRLGRRDPGQTARDLVDPDSVLVRSRHPAEDLIRVVADLVRHLLPPSQSLRTHCRSRASSSDFQSGARVVGLRATGLGATGSNQLAGQAGARPRLLR